MKFRWVALTVVALIGLLAAGLGIAISYGLDWLRVATLIAVPALAGISIMAMKTRSQRKYRVDSPDGVEVNLDREVSAMIPGVIASTPSGGDCTRIGMLPVTAPLLESGLSFVDGYGARIR